MLSTAEELTALTAGRTLSDLLNDRLLMLATVRLLEVIGEAANHVPQSTQDRLQGVPWRAIAGLRNHLVHAYFDVDPNRIWAILNDDLQPLIVALRSHRNAP